MRTLRPLFFLGLLSVIFFAETGKLSSQNLTADTIFVETNKKVRSPHKATMYSVIFPGLGQIYNKKYWKLPILYAGIGATVYAINWNSKNLSKYKNGFRDFSAFYEWKYQAEDKIPQLEKPGADSYQNILKDDWENTPRTRDNWFKTQLKNRKDKFKRDRDFSYIILAAVYVLNIVDAAVDAHFTNFNVNDDLTIRVEPAVSYSAFTGNSVGFKCQITF